MYVPWDLTAIIFPSENPVFKISTDTWTLIMQSDVSDNYEELASWTNEYHGEFYDQAIMRDIARWSLKYKKGFKKFIAQFELKGDIKKLELLGFVIHQSGYYDEFVEDYKSDSSASIKLIINKATDDKNNVEKYLQNKKSN